MKRLALVFALFVFTLTSCVTTPVKSVKKEQIPVKTTVRPPAKVVIQTTKLIDELAEIAKKHGLEASDEQKKALFDRFLEAEEVACESNVAWWDNDNAAIEEASKSNMPVYIFIAGNENCLPCRKTESDVLNDHEVIYYLNKDFISVKLGIDNYNSEKYKIQEYPAHFFLNPNGSIIDYSFGYRRASDFVKMLKHVTTLLKR